MYSLAPEQRLRVKRLAGRIVPAIATTTSAVAGLVSLELLKLAVHRSNGEKQRECALPIELFRNAFLNLALPLVVLSEPAAVARERVNENLTFTVWDRWEIGPPAAGMNKFTVSQFLNSVQQRYGLTPSMVVQGLRMVYLTTLPIYKKRLNQP